MKLLKIFLLLVLGFVFIVGIFLRNPVLNFSTSDFKERALPEKLKSHVEQIGRFGIRNYQNLAVLNSVADYIRSEFQTNCDRVSIQEFEVNQLVYKNVICHFSGANKELIVLGAHYDVAGNQPGADDNASGVAGIIELSRLIRASGKTLSNDLELVAYSLEEPPYFRSSQMGSFIHAKNLADEKRQVKHMISIEMIGYFTDQWFAQKYPVPLLYLFYPFAGDFIALIGGLKEYWQTRDVKSQFSRASEMKIYSMNAPALIPGIDFSDHLNYWEFGFDAYMLTDTSFYRNRNYHETSDTIETLNFDKMAQVVQGMLGFVLTD